MRTAGTRASTGRAAAAAAIAAIGATACLPSAFDETVKKAAARSVQRPSAYNATDFGRIVAPLRPDMTKPAIAGRFLAAGTNGKGISVVELGAAGQATLRNVSSGVQGQFEGKYPSSAVETPTGPAEGRVLLGVPKFQDATGRYFLMGLGADFPVNKGLEPLPSGISNWGIGIGAGNVSGSTELDDYAVLGEELVVLVEDGDGMKQVANSTECDVQLDMGLEQQYRLQRKMVVADVAVGGADEIVVGVPRGGGPTSAGAVRIIRKRPTMPPAMPSLGCVLTLSPPDGAYEGRRRFGYSVAAGDFNDDGMKDLIVGAPPDRAFIYYGPLPDQSMEMMPAPVLPNVALQPMDPMQAKEWGWAVGAVNIDGRGGDEAVVGDPNVTVGGKVAAGQVTIFNIMDTMGTIAATLADTHPEDNAFYGITVNPLRFCAAPCAGEPTQRVLMVGAAAEVYIYFQIAGLAPELRKF